MGVRPVALDKPGKPRRKPAASVAALIPAKTADAGTGVTAFNSGQRVPHVEADSSPTSRDRMIHGHPRAEPAGASAEAAQVASARRLKPRVSC